MVVYTCMQCSSMGKLTHIYSDIHIYILLYSINHNRSSVSITVSVYDNAGICDTKNLCCSLGHIPPLAHIKFKEYNLKMNMKTIKFTS